MTNISLNKTRNKKVREKNYKNQSNYLCFPLDNIMDQESVDFCLWPKRVNLNLYSEVRAWALDIRILFNNSIHEKNKYMILPKTASRTEK